MKKLSITVVLVASMLAMATVPGYAIGSTASWSPVGGSNGLTDYLTYVNALAAVNGTLYAGTSGGVWSWGGYSWSQVGEGSGLTSEVGAESLADVNGTLYAGTYSAGVWSWNGFTWSQVGDLRGLTGQADICAIADFDGTLYVGTAAAGLWSWNGFTWSSQVGDSAGLKYFTALTSESGILYAGTQDGVWSWNGSSWSQLGGRVGLADQAAHVESLAVVNGTLYAGTSGGVWSWDGYSWTQMGDSSGLSIVALVNGSVYAAGTGGVCSWNGSAWSQVGRFRDFARQAVFSLAAINDTLYAGTSAGMLSIPITATLPNKVEFTIGSDQYTADGAAESVYAVPFVKNGRAFLGIRDMGYAIGMEDNDIVWESGNGTATLNYNSHTVAFTLGSMSYTVDGASRQMDATPFYVNGRIFVPARFLAQSFGYQVSWDQTSQAVSLTLQG